MPSWVSTPDPAGKKVTQFQLPPLIPLAAAATVAFLLGTIVMYWSATPERQLAGTPENTSPTAQDAGPIAHGFTVIENLFDAQWQSPNSSFQQGDILGAEVIHLTSGTAEIQFFSGALMTLEGPAEISLKSAWEASCRDGAVRMKVPPAARGFKLHGPSTEIEDLGTEFGLVVRDGHGQVEVFDGEISVRHKGGAEQLVIKGGALDLLNDGPAVEISRGSVNVPDTSEFGERVESEAKAEFEQWQEHREALAQDDRLIAYYGFDRGGADILVPNLTLPRNPEFDGAVIMAKPVSGRWPGHKSALGFHRPGSRVRVNIPGNFPAFTLMCWDRTKPPSGLKTRKNLLANLSFENALEGWSGEGTPSKNPHSGKVAASLKTSGKVQQTANVKPHPTYILSAWAMSPETNEKNLWFKSYLNVAAYGGAKAEPGFTCPGITVRVCNSQPALTPKLPRFW